MRDTKVTSDAQRTSLVPEATRLGPVRIAVTDGERALSVWRDMVGLTVLSRDEKEITLGAGTTPLILLELGAKRPVVPYTAGLYHVAIHVPTRKDLAIVIARLFKNHFRNSPTDHLVTETTYLWDLDGNGIEMTFETPWRGKFIGDEKGYRAVTTEGKEHSGREPVDLDSLFRELGPDENLNAPLPAGTRIGHVHLHVANLEDDMRFFSDVVGFRKQMLSPNFRMADVTVDFPPHILAWNTWAGEGAKQAPPDAAGLRWFTITLPDAKSLADVRDRLSAAKAPLENLGNSAFETRDPAGNRVRFQLAG